MYLYGNVLPYYSQNDKIFGYIEKIKTQTLYSLIFFFCENSAVYEIIQKIMVEPDRPQMTVRGTNDDICIPDDKSKNTDTLS